MVAMFEELEKINERPEPFQLYTASDLWTVKRQWILSTFRRILKPGGTVLLDVYSLAAFKHREEAVTYEMSRLNGFWSPNKHYVFRNTFKYEAEKVILDKYSIIDPDHTRQVYNWFQYFAPEDPAVEFGRADFFVKGFYADVAGTPYDPESNEFAIIAGTA